jgi:hypothetical protein
MQFVDSGIESASENTTETSEEEDDDGNQHLQYPPDDDDDSVYGGPAIDQRSPPFGNMDGFIQSIYHRNNLLFL